MAAEPFTAVGRIVKTHGLKGEVSVVSYGETSLDVLVGLQAWVVPPPAALRTTRITGVRRGPKGPIVMLERVGDIDVARQLAGCELLVATDELPEDWVEEEFGPDFVGFAVTDETRGPLGEIVEVIETGANDVWTVRGDAFGEVLIPVIDEVVLDVDEDARAVRVALLPGLLPGEGEEA